MTRIVILGVDGLDWRFVEANLDKLPTLHRLSQKATLRPLESTFPPDSIPAWTTIFTGLLPAEHGIIQSIDYLGETPAEAVMDAPSVFRGRTFWDRASAAGRSVCVVNAFMAYPAWPVNGVMISGPVFVDSAEPSIFPVSEVTGLGTLPQLGGMVDFPTERTMSPFVDATLRTTREQAEFGLALLSERRPDLFFLNILTIDRLQHFAWRFHDVGDPTYPGPNPYQFAVLDGYRIVDEIVAAYVAAADDATVVVLSDHGHGQRCTRMLFVDELLRRKGIVATGTAYARARTMVLEKTKRFALHAAARCALEEPLYALARRVPGRKKLKTSSYAVAHLSAARPSRLFGRNASGGVEVASMGDADARDALVTSIIRELQDVRDNGGRVVRWARRREEVVQGKHAGRFPAVLFELEDGYGVDFGVYGPLFAADPMHRRISGGHKPQGIFVASRPPEQLPSLPFSIDEFHDFVLRTLEAE